MSDVNGRQRSPWLNRILLILLSALASLLVSLTAWRWTSEDRAEAAQDDALRILEKSDAAHSQELIDHRRRLQQLRQEIDRLRDYYLERHNGDGDKD